MKDMLLHVDSYPEPTPSNAIAQAVRFAAAADSRLSALAVEVQIRAPTNRLADHLIGLSGLAAEEQRKSLRACQSTLEEFSARATAAGIHADVLRTKAPLHGVSAQVAMHARTRDLCIVPIASPLDGQRSIAEAVIFESGRPALVFRPGVAGLPTGNLGITVLAWDGSRAAARTLADALPLLPKARQVRVLTVINEKPQARVGLGLEVLRHLKVHGIEAVAEEVDAGRHRIGEVLESYAAKHRADLLVMGAYGRSRVREFVLGGATEHMLRNTKIPLLLAH